MSVGTMTVRKASTPLRCTPFTTWTGWLQGKPYRTTADMRWGFHQVLLSERAQKIFTFVTPFGTFAYKRLVMGYINATAEFQRHMNNTGPATRAGMVFSCFAAIGGQEYRGLVTSFMQALGECLATIP